MLSGDCSFPLSRCSCLSWLVFAARVNDRHLTWRRRRRRQTSRHQVHVQDDERNEIKPHPFIVLKCWLNNGIFDSISRLAFAMSSFWNFRAVCAYQAQHTESLDSCSFLVRFMKYCIEGGEVDARSLPNRIRSKIDFRHRTWNPSNRRAIRLVEIIYNGLWTQLIGI